VEITTGAQREHRYEVLKAQQKQRAWRTMSGSISIFSGTGVRLTVGSVWGLTG
jgi:hypothetical protein